MQKFKLQELSYTIDTFRTEIQQSTRTISRKKKENIELLLGCADLLKDILDNFPSGKNFSMWVIKTNRIMNSIFGEKSDIYKKYSRKLFFVEVGLDHLDRRNQASVFKAMVELLQEIEVIVYEYATDKKSRRKSNFSLGIFMNFIKNSVKDNSTIALMASYFTVGSIAVGATYAVISNTAIKPKDFAIKERDREIVSLKQSLKDSEEKNLKLNEEIKKVGQVNNDYDTSKNPVSKN